MGSINTLIYFNNNRSTLLHPEVEAAMALSSEIRREQLYYTAKESIASMLNTDEKNIRLTSGTTEAIQLGIRIGYEKNKKKGRHIISCLTEHPAVLAQLRELEKEGASLSFLRVDREGLADPDEFRKLIRSETGLLCLMAANNETGIIHQVEEFSKICIEHGILFFSDASQYVGKLNCDLEDMHFDILAFGSHKMYGPQGIGAVYSRIENSSLAAPQLSKAQLSGFGMACDIFRRDYWELGAEISRLRAYLEHQILDIPEIRINGSTRHRLYNTSNISFPPDWDLQNLKTKFDFADNLNKPSEVLAAMGVPHERNRTSCRFSLGRYNTMEEVKLLVDEINLYAESH